jgi:phasin family protein
MEQTFKKLVAPVKEMNELTLKSIEQIAAIQVKTIRENAKISADSLKSAAEIKNFDSLKGNLENQVSVAQNLYENAVEDAQEVAKLSGSYATSVKEIVERSVPTA